MSSGSWDPFGFAEVGFFVGETHDHGHKKYDLHSIGLQDKENFFLDELINIINDLWYEIDNN